MRLSGTRQYNTTQAQKLFRRKVTSLSQLKSDWKRLYGSQKDPSSIAITSERLAVELPAKLDHTDFRVISTIKN
ncbi:hypothetical protein J6590_058050 [Homalodisca vitripennis]|nr:hypothetical protein J6590_058050 [Homalodisca vitripennis]